MRIPRTIPIGVGEEQKKKVQEDWDTADMIESDLHKLGFVDHPMPEFACPDIDVHTLTNPDSKQYTEAYVKLQSWSNFAGEKFAQIQVRLLQYENMQDILAAQTRQAERERADKSGLKKATAEEMKDRLLLNAEYLEITLKLQHYQQSKIIMGAKVEALERSLRLISRQIEIRRLDIEQQRTGSAMPGRNTRDLFHRGG